MKILSILIVGYAGYLLGTSQLRISPKPAVLTVIAASILDGIVRFSLPHETIDHRLMPAATAWWSPAPMAIAIVETSGIWLPILIVNWAAVPTRIAVFVYILGAGTQAALTYFQPFDIMIVNDEI